MDLVMVPPATPRADGGQVRRLVWPCDNHGGDAVNRTAGAPRIALLDN